MNIIDNFGIQTRRGKDGQSDRNWLERILQETKERSQRDSLLRFTGEGTPSAFHYQLYNNHNKTYAAIRRLNDVVTVQLLARGLPDPEKGFRPALDLVEEHKVPCLPEGLEQAGELIAKHLEQDTPYSTGKVTKIKVTATPKPLEPWTFCGGQITALLPITMPNGEPGTSIVVENGRCAYDLSLKETFGLRVMVLKYVLFNEDGQSHFINSQEFKVYFEMKHVH